MPDNKSLHPHARYKSFSYAIQGLKQLVRTEPNMKIHCIAAVVVIIAGLILHISAMRWMALTIAIAMVMITEALNTCIELLCDLAVGQEIHPLVKKIKDIAAGAVFLASIASVVLAIFIFFF